ncbi:MAG: ABC transporter permease [Verrucomicrobiae bacterium]|nr:ABC transporter permease [Verrucomicrobiae bacterium]
MYFLRRLLYAVPLLLLISLLAFVLVHLAPGGPFDRERRPASPEIERNIQAKYHLDEPVWKQYGRYLNGIVHGDLGPSLKYRNHSVTDIIAQGLPVSMTLGGMAFCFALAVGIPLGFFTAAQRGRWPDYLGSFLAVLAVCVPSFVLAPALILVVALKLKWLPVALWESPWHMILPSLALGSFFVGQVARILREAMVTAAQSEFVTAARAKGLGETTLFLKHVLRIALLPVISYSGPMLADLLTGSFIVESIFQIPGIGVFLVNSSLNLDYPVIVGLSLLYAVLLIGLNLLVDLAYTFLDPRVKYE